MVAAVKATSEEEEVAKEAAEAENTRREGTTTITETTMITVKTMKIKSMKTTIKEREFTSRRASQCTSQSRETTMS